MHINRIHPSAVVNHDIIPRRIAVCSNHHRARGSSQDRAARSSADINSLRIDRCPLCRGAAFPEAGSDPAAGRAGPYKPNIPKADRIIRLSGCFCGLPGLFFLALNLRLELLYLVLLSLYISLILTDLPLSRIDLTLKILDRKSVV